LSQLAREILRAGEVVATDGSHIPLHSGVSEQEGLFLTSLVREVRPRVSLEIGLAFGISALFLCDELQKVGAERHIVIDPCQSSDWKNVGIENLRRAGVIDLVDFHESPAHLALPKLLQEGIEVDFAFIDGLHTFDHALLDFYYGDLLLRVGGMLVFDDANWPALRSVIRFVLRNRRYRPVASLPKRLRLPHLLRRYGSPRALREAFEDSRLGLAIPHSRCVALEKLGNDERPHGFHRDF